MDSKQWEVINQSVRDLDLDPICLKFINCIRPHKTKVGEIDKVIETKLHFNMKSDICYDIMNTGGVVVTEAWTTKRDRKFDVVQLYPECEVIEIETNVKNEKSDADKTIFINPGERGGRDL